MMTQRNEFTYKTIGLPIVLLALALMVPPTRAAQVDMFLKIDDVPGESTDDNHKDWIIINSAGLGVSRSFETGTGGSTRPRSDAIFEDIAWTQDIDKSFPKLFEAIESGQIFTEVDFDFQIQLKNRPPVFFEIDLKNAGVTGLSLAGDTESGLAVAGSLNY